MIVARRNMIVVSKEKQLLDKNKWLDVCFEYVAWWVCLTECPFSEATYFFVVSGVFTNPDYFTIFKNFKKINTVILFFPYIYTDLLQLQSCRRLKSMAFHYQNERLEIQDIRWLPAISYLAFLAHFKRLYRAESDQESFDGIYTELLQF